ncbi:sterol desaturase family protein [Microcoleus sp. F4-D5]|uniref:sterol desaturase family protein n=1 Tax=Microcoleus sp. F4-D5 TaxID=2818760 RepID=UPI002FCF621C
MNLKQEIKLITENPLTGEDKNSLMTVRFRNILTWTVYPGVMSIGLMIYYVLKSHGINVFFSSYIATIIAGVCLITFFELVLPYQKEWLPSSSEVGTDFLFMMLVQVLLPQLISISFVSWLLGFVKNSNWNINDFWPHNYPIWIQILIMILSGDFLRYWLHRAAHTWPLLWRFHAVHHSVHKLYWLNLGRFHPLDRTLQLFCDSFPFILLSISKEVLALYLLIYSIKGFFQHCNIDVKLGWFNYIISGPELHRWHHSTNIHESNNNYGNHIIIWDILFGTYFLPKGKKVSELGLLNRNYPMSFLKQIQAPFIKGIDTAQL